MPKLSQKRIAANRANAARSTGPRTPEGKSRSAQNARKHGFTAAKYEVVRLEELDSVAKLRADLIDTYRPVNSQELFAVERIALAQMSLLRVAALEAGLHTQAMNETVRNDGATLNHLDRDLVREFQVSKLQNRSLCLALGFEKVLRKSDIWRLFLRYQAQTERLYRRAVEEFERLRALRSELPNEPIVEPEPLTTPASDLLPPPPPLTEEEKAERYAALTDPTISVRTWSALPE